MKLADLALAVSLASCVPTTRELRAPVDRALAQRLGDDAARPLERAQLDALLARPLTTATAVRIALAQNARLAAAIAELGIPAGELAAAAVPGPTEFDASLRFGGAGEHELELAAIQDVVGLVTMPRRRAAARADLEGARARAIATAIELAARVEIAVRDVVAAQQEVELRETAFAAADAAATLRERMFDAGNTTALARAREREAREQARLDRDRASATLEVRRAAVEALLGLPAARAWTADDRLPDAPAEAPAVADLEAAAEAASLALAGTRARGDAADARADAAAIRGVLPELGVGVSVLGLPGDTGTAIGPAVRLGIPLFERHQGERAAAVAEREAARATAIATTAELRAHARATRAMVLAAHAEVRRIADVILPLRKQILDETLLHYNAMDADPFALVAARRALVDAGRDYVDALRRYHDAVTAATALRRGVDLGAAPAP